MPVVVVARARAREGKEREAEEAFRAVIPPTHQEDGCLRYALHRAIDDPRTLVMIERWSSKEALDRHLATPHVQKLFAALGDIVESAPELLVTEPLSDDFGEKGRL